LDTNISEEKREEEREERRGDKVYATHDVMCGE
jgi:hypothetical protein